MLGSPAVTKNTSMSEIKLNTIEEALEDFRNGDFVIDEDRENEGDFIIAAENVTPEKI